MTMNSSAYAGVLFLGPLKSPGLTILLLRLNSVELIQSCLIRRDMMTT